jgi:hypothetical protein
MVDFFERDDLPMDTIEENLLKMNNKPLKALIKSRGITLNGAKNKAQYVKRITDTISARRDNRQNPQKAAADTSFDAPASVKKLFDEPDTPPPKTSPNTPDIEQLFNTSPNTPDIEQLFNTPIKQTSPATPTSLKTLPKQTPVETPDFLGTSP